MDGKPMARFSQIEEAVAAVDYELEKCGPVTAGSALPSAAWRRGPGNGQALLKARQLALWERVVRR